ncbi:competence/damage-inducible protein A [Ottowia sp.]|uniref:competence/damage-inducible protein A n=1 Tax=Ottowia sp. TaxID=1898956 RepID=UPI003A89FA1D
MNDVRTTEAPGFGLIVVGDEILSGKRQDKHLAKVAELLAARGLQLGWAEYVGDAPERITATLRRALASGDVVFSTGGIGATPDDHTRQCAASALGVPLALHPQAKALIEERMREVAAEQGMAYAPEHADNQHRLNMGVFPVGADIIPNPYNKIPGFSCRANRQDKAHTWGVALHFVPGFPVMAWPMIEWVLDKHYAQWQGMDCREERSVIVFGAMEATLTPVMERVEAAHPGVKVFSLPSVDHPEYGRHIDLGVKGAPQAVTAAYADLRAWLEPFGLRYGPEMVRQ